jgi:hypothetical protein
MRCCGSRTTSTAEPVPTADAPRAAAAAFAALLIKAAFAPLAKPLGFFGDVAIDACARSLVLRGSSPLVDRLAQATAGVAQGEAAP